MSLRRDIRRQAREGFVALMKAGEVGDVEEGERLTAYGMHKVAEAAGLKFDREGRLREALTLGGPEDANVPTGVLLSDEDEGGDNSILAAMGLGADGELLRESRRPDADDVGILRAMGIRESDVDL